MLQFCLLEPLFWREPQAWQGGLSRCPRPSFRLLRCSREFVPIVCFGNGETEALAWLRRCCRANTFLWFFSTSKGWLLEFYPPRCLLTGLGWRE